MQQRNLPERLVDVSPGMEIWWDSSPIIFENWCQKMLDKAEPTDHATLQAQFARMYDQENPEPQLFRGVTTNPVLSMQAIRDDEEHWRGVASEIISRSERLDEESLFWLLYEEVVRRGSERLLPLFDATAGREGFVSAQVDPRKVFDKEAMLRQAHELRAINRNVMVKIPGSKEGYEVIEELTAEGIPTNNTLTFVLSQLMDCAQTVRRGVDRAKADGADLTQWRSVSSYMLARFGDLGGLRDFAKDEGVELSDADVRMAELAIFKKAHRLYAAGGYQTKLLACALRIGPEIDGSMRLLHLEELAGADIVVTCPPVFWADVLFHADAGIEFEPGRIDVDPPAGLMDKLMRVPYFERAYREDGYSRDEYNQHPGLVKTVEEFSSATSEMVQFAADCLSAATPAR